jgi:hypothetical protein
MYPCRLQRSKTNWLENRVAVQEWYIPGPDPMFPASVPDPRCLSQIRFFSSRISDSSSRIRICIHEFKYFYPKNWSCTKFSKIRSGMFITDPGSVFISISDPDPGPGLQKYTGSRIQIHNTGFRPFRIRLHNTEKTKNESDAFFAMSLACWHYCTNQMRRDITLTNESDNSLAVFWDPCRRPVSPNLT